MVVCGKEDRCQVDTHSVERVPDVAQVRDNRNKGQNAFDTGGCQNGVLSLNPVAQSVGSIDLPRSPVKSLHARLASRHVRHDGLASGDSRLSLPRYDSLIGNPVVGYFGQLTLSLDANFSINPGAARHRPCLTGKVNRLHSNSCIRRHGLASPTSFVGGQHSTVCRSRDLMPVFVAA